MGTHQYVRFYLYMSIKIKRIVIIKKQLAS